MMTIPKLAHVSEYRADRDMIGREAARILERLIEHVDTTGSTDRAVMITATVPIGLFDRLCIWGAASADLEPELTEPDADFEEAVGW